MAAVAYNISVIGAAAGSISAADYREREKAIIERGGNLIQCRLAACTHPSVSQSSEHLVHPLSLARQQPHRTDYRRTSRRL
jgi:hypothetical protein